MKFETVEHKRKREKKIEGHATKYYFVSGDRPFVFEHTVLSDFFGLDVNLRFGFLFTDAEKSSELGKLAYYGRVSNNKVLNELIVHFLTDYKYAFKLRHALGVSSRDKRVTPQDFKIVFLLLLRDFAGELVGDDWEFFKELGKVVLDIDFPQEWAESYVERVPSFDSFQKLRVGGSYWVLANVWREHSGDELERLPSLRRLAWLSSRGAVSLLEEDYKEFESLLELYRSGRVLDAFSRFLFGRDFVELVGEDGRVRYVQFEGAMPVEVLSLSTLLNEFLEASFNQPVSIFSESGSVVPALRYYEALASAYQTATMENGVDFFFDALAVFQVGGKTGVVVPGELPKIYGEFGRKPFGFPIFEDFSKYGDFLVIADDKHFVIVLCDERLRDVFFGEVFEKLDEGAYTVVKELEVVVKDGRPYLRVGVEKVLGSAGKRKVVKAKIDPQEFVVLDRPRVTVSEILFWWW